MDGLFLACLMGICGLPTSPSVEPLMPMAIASPVITGEPRPTSPPVGALTTPASIAPPTRGSEQPLERPVPVAAENDTLTSAAPDGVTAASSSKTTRAAIDDVVRRHSAAVRRCYERGLADDPAFTGTLEAAWRIQVDGRVQSVTIVGGTKRNEGVERCLLAEITRWEFSPTAEPTVVGTYPFTFDASLLARHTSPTGPAKAVAAPARR